MGDAENQPSKKRAAGVQLSRDNPGLDDNEDTSELETGTFKKASEEVLATRRIVKVRRNQTSSAAPDSAPSAASNPFAAINLVSSSAAPAPLVEVEASSGKGKEATQIDDSKSENKVDEPKGESTAVEKTGAIDDSKSQPDAQKEEKPVVDEAAEGGKSVEEVVEKATEGDDSKTEAGKEAEDKKNDQENGNDDKNGETASFSSFQQLSSNQNAFSGLTGTGFSSTSFSFGSISKDGTSQGTTTNSLFGLKSENPPTFSFGGVSNNGNSSPIFSSSGATTISNSEGSKLTPMQEVPVETGEENEKAVLTADSVLFEFLDGSWKERGKGELKVNVQTTGTGKARLIMRARGNYRLILNASLFPDMKLTNMDKKGVTFACVNSAGEGKQGLSTFALKFRDASIVEDFKAAVMEYKAAKETPVSLKTPENSPRASEA